MCNWPAWSAGMSPRRRNTPPSWPCWRSAAGRAPSAWSTGPAPTPAPAWPGSKTRADRAAQGLAERAPVAALGLHRGQQLQLDAQAPRRRDPPQALRQRGVADELRGGAETLARLMPAQHHRQHRCVHRHRGLQQIGMEGQQFGPRAGGALREHRHAVTGTQRRSGLVDDAQCIALAAALDEERAGTFDQRAHQRPMPHVGLGHEAGLRQHRMQRGDVQPGHMVGHQQVAGRPGPTLGPELDAQDLQCLDRPPLHQLMPLDGGAQFEVPLDQPKAVQHMRQQPGQTPGGDEGPHAAASQRAAPAALKHAADALIRRRRCVRPPGCSAPAPAARSHCARTRRACACPGWRADPA
mmetsp:Transcript_62039/g.146946  ORF Transcript_62039/g.146946 Transcript_62039/m.146946 type:complete len:353 (-) Transcript_62039:767-1825(-)